MDALAVGDVVASGPDGAVSPVYLFSHADAAAVATFVRLTTVNGSSLTATPGHYVRLAGFDGRLVAAAAVRVGDVLARAAGGGEAVASARRVSAVGLYNPHTLSGEVVVDGFVTSTHTTAVDPALARAALAPARALYAVGGVGVSKGVFAGGWPRLVHLLPSGAERV